MATIKVILYKQKTLSDGTHPVMLQVVHDRKPYKVSLGYSCNPENWDETKNRFKRNFEGSKTKNEILRDAEIRADWAIDQIRKQGKPFSSLLFKELYNGVNKNISVFDFFGMLIDDLGKKGKAGNKVVYYNTRTVLRRFCGGNKNVMLSDINYQFLKKFETYLFSEGCSGGGASVYMRTLRAALNEAIRQGYLDRDLYPFSTAYNKNGYSIAHLKSTASPRALSIEDMEKIKNFPVQEYPHLIQSYQLFMFSYYARGMNFKDMALLKWSDIYNGRINYTREKTGKFLTLKVSENLQAILDEFPKESNKFVFPILSDFHKTPEQVKNRVKKCLKQFNKDLKEIADILGIDAKITSYVARHTFATTLKKKKADIAVISEALGHEDIGTTKAYLKRFEDSDLDRLDELL